MIKKIYANSIATVQAARYCILGVILIYICTIIIGWQFSDSFPFIEKQVRELTKGFVDKSAPVFILKIFARNLVASYMVTCAISLWGFVPAFAAAANGLLLGWVIAAVTGPTGMTYSKLAFMLIPHGIFEWPAMLIGWGTGSWKGLGYRFTSGAMTYAERFKKANAVYFTIVFPLLMVAAVIEGRYHIVKQVFG